MSSTGTRRAMSERGLLVFSAVMLLAGILVPPPAGAATVGNATSSEPAINADGRFVAFSSNSTNLVSGDTNGKTDVCVRDRLLGKTERVGVSTRGKQGDGDSVKPAISADGRYVTFESAASNLVKNDTNGSRDVFLRDRTLKKTV